MKKIEEYDFIDCVLIDFKVNKTISEISITTEAYYPGNGQRNKGLIKIDFRDINVINVNKTEELEFDLNLPYDSSDNHFKANEIYLIKVSKLNNDFSKALIDSDFLKLDFNFREIEIKEIIH